MHQRAGTLRRWRERYEEGGFRGLLDRRQGRASPKRVPLAVVERVLALYGERYFELNLTHSREAGLRATDGAELQLVKGVLQGSAPGRRGRKRGAPQTPRAATS